MMGPQFGNHIGQIRSKQSEEIKAAREDLAIRGIDSSSGLFQQRMKEISDRADRAVASLPSQKGSPIFIEYQTVPSEHATVSVSTLVDERRKFLFHTYSASAASPFVLLSVWKIGEEVGFDQFVTQRTYSYLESKGWVEGKTLGGDFVITNQGITEFEQTSAH